mmetsp:Transcript_34771/g.95891  ORF Transcript_34771/g.95891 Transcript_34771/m.95891 type:complete len:262 (+) Transcript_34771:98-883(+)
MADDAASGSQPTSNEDAERVLTGGVGLDGANADDISSLESAAERLAGIDGGLLGAAGDSGDVRAALGSMASGLAEQLTSITEEMNKIREELYGESGIGGIAKELEKLKSGGLGGVLDDSGVLDGLLNQVGSGASSSSNSSSRSSRHGAGGRTTVTGSNRNSVSVGLGGSSEVSELRQRRTPEERNRELEELRRKLRDSSDATTSRSSTMWEQLVLLAIVVVCLYVASPFFRTALKSMLVGMVYGELPDAFDVDQDEADFEF